ncbi:MAG: type II toxin-antitoxin system RelB/DinJ family antitoxin [Rhodospirillales bacterium]|nr:type II toxin-antitoxin system RelB/DinJ family antitoxin [Rhodospirillales bacterium]MSP81144.1 type II toxin-antitoxin system RelB/DinJ family antitoxin [Rhodospirillales bacterium]
MTVVVRARIDERVKKDAAAVLASIGLTVSDAFRLMMVRIATEKRLPFEPLVPNAETIEAMRAARRGDLIAVGSADKLLADLNADD